MPSSLYAVSGRHVSRRVGGETVILGVDGAAYYTLNEVGSFVWQMLCEGPQSVDALCQHTVGEFEVTPQRCRDDIEQLIRELREAGLVGEAD